MHIFVYTQYALFQEISFSYEYVTWLCVGVHLVDLKAYVVASRNNSNI